MYKNINSEIPINSGMQAKISKCISHCLVFVETLIPVVFTDPKNSMYMYIEDLKKAFDSS